MTRASGRFKGKSVWITGASSGIGEALAMELAKDGANLILSARREKELDRVASAYGGRAKTLQMDMSIHDIIPSKIEEAKGIFGTPDILISNAGIGQRGKAMDCSLGAVKSIFDTNLFGAIELSRLCAKEMVRRRSGTIVCMSSVLGLMPLPGRSSYAASKHALEGYFQTMRFDLEGSGIKVAIVRPGWIDTHVSSNAIGPDGKPSSMASSNTGNRMSPKECARRICNALTAGWSDIHVGGYELFGVAAMRFLPSRLSATLFRQIFRGKPGVAEWMEH